MATTAPVEGSTRAPDQSAPGYCTDQRASPVAAASAASVPESSPTRTVSPATATEFAGTVVRPVPPSVAVGAREHGDRLPSAHHDDVGPEGRLPDADVDRCDAPLHATVGIEQVDRLRVRGDDDAVGIGRELGRAVVDDRAPHDRDCAPSPPNAGRATNHVLATTSAATTTTRNERALTVRP